MPWVRSKLIIYSNDEKRQAIGFILLSLAKGIAFKPWCVFENVKMKTDMAMKANNLKALHCVPAQRFSRNSEKFAKNFLGNAIYAYI